MATASQTQPIPALERFTPAVMQCGGTITASLAKVDVAGRTPAELPLMNKAVAAARTAGVILGPALVADLAAGLSVAATLAGLLRPAVQRRLGPLLLPVAFASMAAVAYALAVRSRQLTWGATDDERGRVLSGDSLIARPAWEATRAITINMPPHVVWPWLVQLGQGRGGFYTYDWLENLAGLDIHSVDRISPELQQLKVGDCVRFAPALDIVRVAQLEPPHALVLRLNLPLANTGATRTAAPVDFTWAYVLEPLGEGATRLIVRSRLGGRAPRLVAAAYVLAVEPQHFIMERKMLLGIKQRAERRAAATAPALANTIATADMSIPAVVARSTP